MKKINIFTLCMFLLCIRSFSAEDGINLADICKAIEDEHCMLYIDSTDDTVEIDGTKKKYYDKDYTADVIQYNNFKTMGETYYQGTKLVFSGINSVLFSYDEANPLNQSVIDLSLDAGGVVTFDVEETVLLSNLMLKNVGRVTLQGTDDIEAPLVITLGQGFTIVHTEEFDWEEHSNGTEFFISGSLQFEKIRFDDVSFGVQEETIKASVTLNGTIDLAIAVGDDIGGTETTLGYITDFTFHNKYMESRISSVKIVGNAECDSFAMCHNEGNEPTNLIKNSRLTITTGGVMDIPRDVSVYDNGALIVGGRLYAGDFNVDGAYSYVYTEDSVEVIPDPDPDPDPDPVYHEGMISVVGESTITATTLFSVEWFKTNSAIFTQVVNAQIENFDARTIEFDDSIVQITKLMSIDDSMPPEETDETKEPIFMNEGSSLYYQNREGTEDASPVSSILLKNGSEVTIEEEAVISFAHITLEDEGGTLTINNFESGWNDIYVGRNSVFNVGSFNSERDNFILYNSINISGDSTVIEAADFRIYMVTEGAGGSIFSDGTLTFNGHNSVFLMLEPKFVIDKTEESKGKFKLGEATAVSLDPVDSSPGRTDFDITISSVLYEITEVEVEAGEDSNSYYFEYYRAKNYSEYLTDVKNSNRASGILLSETDAIKLDNAIAIGRVLDNKLGAILEDPVANEVLYNLTLAVDGNSFTTEDLVTSLTQINVDTSGTNYKDIETLAENITTDIFDTFNNKDIENTPWVSYISNFATNDDMDSNISGLVVGFTKSTSNTGFQYGASFGLLGGKAKNDYRKNQYSMISFAGYFNLAISDITNIDIELINFFDRIRGDRYIGIMKDMPEYYNPTFADNNNVQSISMGVSRKILFNKNMLHTRFSANVIRFSSLDYTEESSLIALDASYGNYVLSNLALDVNYSYYLGYSGDYLLTFGINSAYYFQGINGPNVTASFADSGMSDKWNISLLPFNKYTMGFNASLKTSSFILYIKYSYEGNYQSASFGINYYKGLAVYSILDNTDKDLKNLL